MIINESIIKDGITSELLNKLISKHISSIDKYSKLRSYYKGQHDILNRRRSSGDAANNKVVCNYAKYITDMSTSYLIGVPVSYAPSDGYDIEALKNAYFEQDISSVDAELVKQCSIYGHTYELIYADENSKPRSTQINPEQAFVVYNDDCKCEPLFGVYYYKTYDIDGNVSGVVCNVYTDSEILVYRSKTDSWRNMQLEEKSRHYFGDVPLIEYRNNSEIQGDFEQLIPLIDAYNVLQSDRVNDKEQFVDAFLFLTGIDIDSEQAKKLREERILMGYEGAAAQYLSKVMTESDIQVLSDNIKADIHKFSCVPDLSDESFGNNLSGVAIKYKLMGFEQQVRNKERYIARSLKERFKLYTNYLSLKGAMEWIPVHRIDIVFTRNLPVNNLEVAQMINNLNGMVTQETLLGQLDFVGDPKEEAELAKKEQADKQRQAMDAMDYRDYGKPIKTNENKE